MTELTPKLTPKLTAQLTTQLTAKSAANKTNEEATGVHHLVAVELGSNSFHLIIAREQDGCLQILHRQKQSIGLASGLDTQNNLNQSIIDKAVNCLREFNLLIIDLPCSTISIVATYALRNARNIEHFKQQVSCVFPHPIEVISGKLEAELIYKGVAHTQPLRGATFIVDIGGGSTELVVGQGFSTLLTDSLPMGCISVQQQFFRNGNINAATMRDAQEFVTEKLSEIADRYREFKSKTILGTSGSIKVINNAIIELYGDNKITPKRLNRLVKQLIQWQHFDNIPLRSLEESRRPLFASAVAILSGCFKQLNIDQMKFSLGGLREGVLYDLSQSRTDIDTRERTIHNLIKLYHIDQAFTQRVLQQLALIKQQLSLAKKPLSNAEFTLLSWAAQLHEIGIAINSKKRQKHGAYIIKHSEMPGFSENEKDILTLLISNHRGKIKLGTLKLVQIAPITKITSMSGTGDNDELSPETPLRLGLLVQLLRIAIILTQGRVKVKSLTTTVSLSQEQLIISPVIENELGTKLHKEVQEQASAKLLLVLRNKT